MLADSGVGMSGIHGLADYLKSAMSTALVGLGSSDSDKDSDSDSGRRLG